MNFYNCRKTLVFKLGNINSLVRFDVLVIKILFPLTFHNSGIVTGIYTTNSPEACHYIAHDCRANIVVVENQKQLDKIIQVRNLLLEFNLFENVSLTLFISICL